MARIIAQEAEEHGSELIVFPELSNSGYICPFHGFDPEFARRYYAVAEPIPGPTTDLLGQVARQHNAYVVTGLAQAHPNVAGMLYNSAVLIGPSGRVEGLYHKVHIPAGEKHYFVPGGRVEVFETPLGTIGLMVCYDGRFPELCRVLALKGAEIICSVWNRPFIDGYLGAESNRALALVRAQENGVYYIHSNRAGQEGDTKFLGHSAIGAPNGEIIAASDTAEEDVIRAVLRRDVLIDARAFLSVFRDRRPDVYGEIVKPLSDVSL